MFSVPIVMLFAAMLAACFAVPQQAAAEDFYAGKTLTILVGGSRSRCANFRPRNSGGALTH
jgi:hypothetical protein